MTTPGIVFFGSHGIMSVRPLRALLEHHYTIVGVVVPATRDSRALGAVTDVSDQIPVRNASADSDGLDTLAHVAHEHGIPIFEVGGVSHPETVDVISSLSADVFCVSCFPYLLPESLLHLPILGGLNVHPSMLPAHRGPDPLFWAFHAGETETGVTVHRMTEVFDAGAILEAAPIPMEDGITERQLQRRCSEAGADLLVSSVSRIVSGTLSETSQESSRVSYDPMPVASDYVVSTSWPVRRAFNFMSGISGRGIDFTIVGGDSEIKVRRVLRPVPESSEASMSEDGHGIVNITFSDGLLCAKKSHQ